MTPRKLDKNHSGNGFRHGNDKKTRSRRTVAENAARSLFLEGKYQQSEQMYSSIIDQGLACESSYIEYICLLRLRYTTSNLLERLKCLVNSHPACSVLHHEIGKCCSELGLIEDAKERLSLALSMDPCNREYFKTLAGFFRQQGNDELELNLYRQYVASISPDPEIFYYYGTCLARSGNLLEAILPLKNSLEIYPESPQAHHAIAQVYAGLSLNDEALSHLYKYTELAQTDSTLYSNIAEIHIMLSDYAKAIECLSYAMQLEPWSLDLTWQYGDCLIEQAFFAETKH